MYITALNPAPEKSSFGFSKLDFTNFRNKQQQNKISGLLTGLPKLNQGVFGPLSPSFLYQIYDAKAVTPNIINNYLTKVDQILSTDAPSPEENSEKKEYRTLVDEILEKAQGKNEEEKEGDEEGDSPTPTSDDESDENPSGFEHYGIVGEIFNKYA